MSNSFKEGLNNLRELSNGDEAFVDEMLEIFLRTTPKTLSEIDKGFQNADPEHIAAYAHKLKSSLQVMGNDELKQLTKNLEHGARQGHELSALQAFFDRLQEQMNKLNSSIEEKLTN